MASPIQVRQRRGIGLPALRLAGGYFASKSRADDAWSALIIAVFTPRGSRPMNRDFGSNVHDTLFEPIAGPFERMVDRVIRDAAQRWAPHVRVDGVAVNSQAGKVHVHIAFSLANDSTVNGQRPLVFSKSDITSLLHASRA